MTGSSDHHGRMNNTDPRPSFAKSLELAGATINAVKPDQLNNSTPCGNYNVRELLGHLLSGLDRAGAVGRNENPFGGPETIEAANGDWIAAWEEMATQTIAAWVDPATLTRPTALPWAAESGALALWSYVAEITVHTWDLAQATNQNPAWDNDVVSESLAVMERILPAAGRTEMFASIRATMPEDMRDGPAPYASAVPVDTNATLINRLVAHVGRDPR